MENGKKWKPLYLTRRFGRAFCTFYPPHQPATNESERGNKPKRRSNIIEGLSGKCSVDMLKIATRLRKEDWEYLLYKVLHVENDPAFNMYESKKMGQ